MPLVLRPITENDTFAWTRIRTLAYHGPLHTLTHTQPLSESSLLSIAQHRRKELHKPSTWHWKVVDTDLPPSDDDPSDNNGRTIAIAVWSAHNVPVQITNHAEEEITRHDKADGNDMKISSESNKTDDKEKSDTPFTPPELRTDILNAVLTPLRSAQEDTMGTETPYLKLDTLATHPAHHRRGAAKMLLEWGVGKADEEGWRTYLDASPVGVKSYERVGFRIVKEVVFERGEWGGEGRDWWGVMVREVGGK